MSQSDEFDKSMDRLGHRIEKTVSGIEKGATVLSKVQQGCMLVFINLFLCAFFSWGVYDASGAIRWQLKGETVPAIVTGLNETNDPKLGRRYTSIVEYNVDGRAYTAEVGEPSIPAEYEVGETVPVRYLRDDPQTAQLENGIERWLFPMTIIPAMIIAAVILNFRVVRAWRRGEDVDLGHE